MAVRHQPPNGKDKFGIELSLNSLTSYVEEVEGKAKIGHVSDALWALIEAVEDYEDLDPELLGRWDRDQTSDQ